MFYACLDCNSTHKGEQFAVLQAGTQTPRLVDVTRPKRAAIVAPQRGYVDALINPREEDPLQFMQLDLGTFHFVPIDMNSQSEANIRASYTIKILGLNKRTVLIRGRRTAFQNFLSRLSDYVNKRATLGPAEIQKMKDSLRLERHLSVWEEMKRQRSFYGELDQLFSAAPEALAW
jgi:hypothetical protein